MAGYTPKQNTAGANHGKRKALVAAVLIVAVSALILIAILFSKDSVFLAVSKLYAQSGNYKVAASLIEHSGHEKADAVSDYVNLRLEINKSYPVLLSEYDAEKIEAWAQTAENLCSETDALGSDLALEATQLSDILSQIVEAEREYNSLRSDILEMMDVFNEINRLHTKDAEGKNTAFTIADERLKIEDWAVLNDKILEFISSIPGSENIYLFNYMAKEVQGEISELTVAIDGVAESGYAETDLVRFSGDAERRFPDITNSSGESVNLIDKETYEKFMYEEFCNKLIQNLASYYAS